ncbi:Putative dNTP triphosphohydrolase, associated with nucleotidase YfbR [Legionella pneumophila subsp. pneumophila LPE509]|nr:Putative dNTP triphosphohydrolase, associated with nucleotidase YfbR [Legionella pneumophila subsp. pneumophila LPE509]
MSHHIIQCDFSSMSEGRMANIMKQTNDADEVIIWQKAGQ